MSSCNHDTAQVVDTRKSSFARKRRVYQCSDCDERFVTLEVDITPTRGHGLKSEDLETEYDKAVFDATKLSRELSYDNARALVRLMKDFNLRK